MKHKEFPVPVVTVGPGSQEPDEEQLSYIEMPKEMSTFSMPRLPEPEDVKDAPEACAAVGSLYEAARDWRPGARNTSLDLAVLDARNREVVDQILGEGEVSIIVSGARETRIQESVFPGVWRVQEFDPGGRLLSDQVEVGPVPAVTLRAAREAASSEVPARPAPADAFGARPILEEVAYQASSRKLGDPAHIINLSLLPMSPSDAAHLGEVLAAGPVRILSRGYGNCRITSTVVTDTWWVQYVNGYGNPMVDSIEITDVPEVALASVEDIADSAQRLHEALVWLEKG